MGELSRSCLINLTLISFVDPDDDVTGFVSIKEVNKFANSRPDGWRSVPGISISRPRSYDVTAGFSGLPIGLPVSMRTFTTNNTELGAEF